MIHISEKTLFISHLICIGTVLTVFGISGVIGWSIERIKDASKKKD